MDISSPEAEKKLREGAERIFSVRTAPCRPAEEGVYKSSTHPVREFVFALSGNCNYMLNGGIYELTPGTLLLIDSWVRHAEGYTPEDNNLLHLWGHFFADGLQVDLLRVGNAGKIVFEEIRNLIIPDCIAQAASARWDRLDALEAADEAAATTLMRSPIDLILDETACQLSSLRAVSGGSLVSVMQSYIRSKNGRDCSLEHLQKISGFSRYYLCRLFRQETGITIGDFINLIREDYTRAALKHGRKQKEIAFELGFSSASAFWNWYQKHHSSSASAADAEKSLPL